MDGKRPSPFADRGGSELILGRLMRISEIDVPQAVSRMMGRQDLYVQLACRIAAERADMVVKLREALRQDNREAMIEVIHGAKSILGMLGADALQQRCILLQQKLGAGDAALDEVASFLVQLESLLQHLQTAIAGQSGANSDQSEALPLDGVRAE